jgi:hypothetical protein
MFEGGEKEDNHSNSGFKSLYASPKNCSAGFTVSFSARKASSNTMGVCVG